MTTIAVVVSLLIGAAIGWTSRFMAVHIKLSRLGQLQDKASEHIVAARDMIASLEDKAEEFESKIIETSKEVLVGERERLARMIEHRPDHWFGSSSVAAAVRAGERCHPECPECEIDGPLRKSSMDKIR